MHHAKDVADRPGVVATVMQGREAIPILARSALDADAGQQRAPPSPHRAEPFPRFCAAVLLNRRNSKGS